MKVQRRQVPLRLAYAVTFNKSQGKTLDRAVVDLRGAPFAHGQLYVALSRVRRRQDIRLLCDAVQVGQDGAERFVVAQNVVERKQYVTSMPLPLRAAFLAAFPEPPTVPAPAGPAAGGRGGRARGQRAVAPGRGRGRAAAPARAHGRAAPHQAAGRGRRGAGRPPAQRPPAGARGRGARGRGRRAQGRGRAQVDAVPDDDGYGGQDLNPMAPFFY